MVDTDESNENNSMNMNGTCLSDQEYVIQKSFNYLAPEIIRGIPPALLQKREIKNLPLNCRLFPSAYWETQYFCKINKFTTNSLINELLRGWNAGQRLFEKPEEAQTRKKYVLEHINKHNQHEKCQEESFPAMFRYFPSMPDNETKNLRVTFLLFPSIYLETQYSCKKLECSPNSLINELICSWNAGQRECETPDDAQKREQFVKKKLENRNKEE